MSLAVRLEDPRDRDAALEVERLAFGSDEEPSIVETVRDGEGSFALVAEEDGEVVGHVQFSRAWIGPDAVLALGPIGVRPDRQDRGIGGALIEAGLAEARGRGEALVILIGSPEYYPGFGFEAGAAYGLRNPFAGLGEDDFVIAEEDFMLRRLSEEPLVLAGPVRWHPAFGQPAVEGPFAGA